MYKVKIEKLAQLKLDRFINWYKRLFINLYSDSWLVNEKAIIENYITIWDELNSLIHKKLNSTLKEELILCKWIKEDWKKYIIIHINNFRLFSYYSENEKMKERYIEDLEIYKK